MKSHDEIRSMLAAMAGNDLPIEDRTLLEQHLDNCQSCRAELTQLQQVVQAVRSTPDLEPPPWLATRIMARVREEAVPSSNWFARLFLPMHLKLPLEAFALVMICVTALYVMQDVEKNTMLKTESHSQTSGGPADAAHPLKTTENKQTDNADKKKNVDTVMPQAPKISIPATAVMQPPAADKAVSEASKGQQMQSAPSFAPQPPNRTAPSMESAEKSRPSAEAPSALSAQRREEPASATSAPAAERKKAVMPKSEVADRALSAASVPVLHLRVVVDNPESYPDRLRNLVKTAGGVILSSSHTSARCRIDTSRLQEFLSGLSQISRFASPRPENIPQAGVVIINISW